MRLHPRVRTQAYLVGALPLAFLVLLLALSLLIQARVQASASLEERAQAVLGRVDHVRRTLEEASAVATAPSLRGSSARLASLRASIDGDLRALRPLVRDEPGMAQRLALLANDLHRGLDLIDRFASLRRAGKTAQAHAISAQPSTRALSTHLSAAYDGMIGAERQRELHRLAQVRAGTTPLRIALIAACSFGIVLTLVVFGEFGLRIVRRLEHLGENARRLARGESAAPLRGGDEFSQLDKVYRDMMLQIAREQQLNSRLQRMLLPQQLPTFDGIRIDTAYVPAARENEVGGDWYDAFPLSDRCICIGIGDVAGHGLRAAAVMASARLAVRTAARIQSDPGEILGHLNRVLCADEPDTIVTALVALLDVDDGTLRYAVAGHPKPLVIRADGEIDALPGSGLVLGADPSSNYETYRANLHEGWALLLYTDGLVEVAHDYIAGMQTVRAAAAAEYASSSHNIAEAIQQRVLGGKRTDDDAAVLFLGVTRLGLLPENRARRSWIFDAQDAESAHRAKRAILWHLGDTIRDASQLASIELVLGELVGNVARHSPGMAEISLEQQGQTTVLRVCDRGKPFAYLGANGAAKDLYAESGRGLFLVGAMASDVRVEHDGTGNVVTAVLPASA